MIDASVVVNSVYCSISDLMAQLDPGQWCAQFLSYKIGFAIIWGLIACEFIVICLQF